jgi:flagella basal body P-ring formation protein FlgA
MNNIGYAPFKNMMKQKTTLLMALVCMTGLSGQSQAAAYQSLTEITDAVKAFLLAKDEIHQYPDTVVQVHSIDKRLNLSKCEKINYQLSSGAKLIGKTTVKVSCEAPKIWSFYVNANISCFTDVYTLNGNFNKGHIIRQSDVYKVRKDLARLPFGYITEKEQIVGKEIKRNLQAGRPVTPSQIRNPLLIKRGGIVSLQNKTAGFTVQMKGVAMMDGAAGDRIRVKNSSSDRIVEGTVDQSGNVDIAN